MKHLTCLSLLFFFFTGTSALWSQKPDFVQNIEGTWYLDAREAPTYIIWYALHPQTLESKTFSIVCGDTVLQSQSLLQFAGDSAVLYQNNDGAWQAYQLTYSDNDQAVWKCKQPGASPENISWHFGTGDYLVVRTDDEEQTFRRVSHAPVKMKLRASAGLNLSQYTHAAGVNHFLANNNIGYSAGQTDASGGKDFALSAGLLFQSTPVCLNLELGMSYREVHVQANFLNNQPGFYADRDGYYQNTNYYLAFIPEVYIGKKRNLSACAGFYADIYQQRSFKGTSTDRLDPSKSAFGDPDHDIDYERGLIAGVYYRFLSKGQFHPQAYFRYNYGLNNTHLRAFSIGLALELEKG